MKEKQIIRYRRRLARAKNWLEVELLAMGIDMAGLLPCLYFDIAAARQRVA